MIKDNNLETEIRELEADLERTEPDDQEPPCRIVSHQTAGEKGMKGPYAKGV